MNIKQLKEALSHYPEDATVVINDYETGNLLQINMIYIEKGVVELLGDPEDINTEHVGRKQ